METFSALLALWAGNSPVPVNPLRRGQWRGALMFSLICAWIKGWVNNRKAGDLRRRRAHYDVILIDHSKWIQLSMLANLHYSDIMMSAMASQITGVSIFCTSAAQRKHQSSASLAFVMRIYRSPINSPHKKRRKCFHLMTSSWDLVKRPSILSPSRSLWPEQTSQFITNPVFIGRIR